MKKRVALIGARGYTGRILIPLLEKHLGLELIFAGSRAQAGEPLSACIPSFQGDLCFEAPNTERVRALEVDALILALPNGLSEPYLEGLSPEIAVIDLSADHRFDPEWIYGWPERYRAALKGARRIANPGCYATGMQAALWPLLELLEGVPNLFGVSGYSGAGMTPSPKNDPEVLRDNLLPYTLTEHLHEREVSHQLKRPIRFLPHVAPFFRGISLSLSARLKAPCSPEVLEALYLQHYREEPLIHWSREAPLVREAVGNYGLNLGGLSLSADGRDLALIITLDNLLKGAASQALQNLNLALGFEELEGLR